MAKNLVPFNIEAEKAVIGSMIASKKVCFNALNMLDAIDFYDEKANQVIFTAIKNLDLQGKEVLNYYIQECYQKSFCYKKRQDF